LRLFINDTHLVHEAACPPPDEQTLVTSFAFADCPEARDSHLVRLPSDLRPIFHAHVFVNLNIRRVQGIPTVFVATGNPVLFPGLDIDVVRLESAPGQSVKGFAVVVE